MGSPEESENVPLLPTQRKNEKAVGNKWTRVGAGIAVFAVTVLCVCYTVFSAHNKTPLGDGLAVSFDEAPIWADLEKKGLSFPIRWSDEHAKDAKLLVYAYCSDMSQCASFEPAMQHLGLKYVVAGEGTTWHGFEDKMVGFREVLKQLRDDQIVMFVDGSDILHSCGEEELLRRFNSWNVDIMFVGENGHNFHPRTSLRVFQNLGEGGGGKTGPVVLSGGIKRSLNSGTYIGTRKRLMGMIDDIEANMLRLSDEHINALVQNKIIDTWNGWQATCIPPEFTHEQWSALAMGPEAGPTQAGDRQIWSEYHDQTCVGASAARMLLNNDNRIGFDERGALSITAYYFIKKWVLSCTSKELADTAACMDASQEQIGHAVRDGSFLKYASVNKDGHFLVKDMDEIAGYEDNGACMLHINGIKEYTDPALRKFVKDHRGTFYAT